MPPIKIFKLIFMGCENARLKEGTSYGYCLELGEKETVLNKKYIGVYSI